MFKENAYVISGGPVEKTIPQLLLALAKHPQQQCFLQRYNRKPDGSFTKVFAHNLGLTFRPTFCQEAPHVYNEFCLIISGQVEAIYDLDDLSSHDPIIALIQNPELEVRIDYDPARGLGIISQIGCYHNWTNQAQAMPHLLTAINRNVCLTTLHRPQLLDDRDRVIQLPNSRLRALQT